MVSFFQWLPSRLKQKLPGVEAQNKMARMLKRPRPDHAPEDARVSAVLVLLYPKLDDVRLVLIARTVDGTAHGGQIAFPGGKKEITDIDLKHTALRETNEEIGLNPNVVEIIGELTQLYIPVSNFLVQPFLAYVSKPQRFIKDEREVADILDVSLGQLFDSKSDTQVTITHPYQGKIEISAYVISETVIVWGATAMILSELESLWDEYNALHHQ